MRYNPQTDNARAIEEIADECRTAIQRQERIRRDDFELLHLYTASLGNRHPRSFYRYLEMVTAMHVAEAMGDFPEYRRLRSCLLTGLL